MLVIRRPSQYEVKLKAWAVHKYVKISDWRIILTKMEELKSAGVPVRMKLLGQVVNKKKIDRNRHRVNKGSDVPVGSFSECQQVLLILILVGKFVLTSIL